MSNDSPCISMDFYPKKKHSEPCCINFEIFGSPAVLSLFLAPTSYSTSGMQAEDRWWEEAVFVKSSFDVWKQPNQGSWKPLQAKKSPLTLNISRRWKPSSRFHCPWPELLIWRKKCGMCLKLRKFMLANRKGGGGLSKLGLSFRHITLMSLLRALRVSGPHSEESGFEPWEKSKRQILYRGEPGGSAGLERPWGEFCRQ